MRKRRRRRSKEPIAQQFPSWLLVRQLDGIFQTGSTCAIWGRDRDREFFLLSASSSTVNDATLSIIEGSSIFGAFDRQEPVQVSNHEPFKRPGRRKEVNEEEEQELTCPTLVDPLRGRQQIKATLLSYILLCFVISIVGLSSTPSVVLEESLGIGIDHHLSIQTKQGVFRGLLMTSEVSDWPSGLQSQKINSETLSDIIVGFLGELLD